MEMIRPLDDDERLHQKKASSTAFEQMVQLVRHKPEAARSTAEGSFKAEPIASNSWASETLMGSTLLCRTTHSSIQLVCR